MRRKFYLLTILIIATGLLFAQEWVNYDTTGSDLIGDVINDVIEDEYGNIWVATSSGLSRYNGTEWRNYTTDNSGLPSNTVRCLAFNLHGEIVIGTNSGLAVYNGIGEGNQGWTVFNMTNSPLPRNVISALTIDSMGIYWIGMLGGGGLARFDGTSWSIFTTGNSDLPNNYVYALTVTSDQQVWVGTNSGIGVFDGLNWTVYNSSNSQLIDNAVRALTVDENNDVYIGTSSGGMTIAREFAWSTYSQANSPIPSNSVSDIAVQSPDVWWITTSNNGLVKFNNNYWSVYNSFNSELLSNDVNTIIIDENGWKWVGTGAGLSNYREITVTGVSMNPEFLIIPKESEYQLEALISPENASNREVSWYSSNSELATVLDNGFLIALRPGSVIITAMTDDGSYTAICDVEITGTVSDPQFTPSAGEYQNSVLVTISTDTDESLIHFTLDGSEPTLESEVYSVPIEITESTLIRARAFLEHWEASEIVIAQYDIVTSVDEEWNQLPEALSATMFPNPLFIERGNSRNSIHLNFRISAPKAGDVGIEIYDIRGRKLYTNSYTLSSGEQIVTIPISEVNNGNLSNGIYLYHVSIDDQYHDGRFSLIR